MARTASPPLAAALVVFLGSHAPAQSVSFEPESSLHWQEGGALPPDDATAHPAEPEGDADLAKKLANPIADLISIPFQFNFDHHIGPGDGERLTVNFQPVVPFSISEDWLVISRTIVPIIYQHDVFGADSGDQFGLGNTLQSFFFSPKGGDLIWGVGPAISIPTNTDDELGADQWGLGPTAVVLKQSEGWTYGMLANQIWSIGGDDGLPPINQTFMQPFLTYTTKDAWSFGVQTQTTYDWERDEWSIPLQAQIAKLIRIGRLPVQCQVAGRYWADTFEGGPEDFSLQVQITILLPR